MRSNKYRVWDTQEKRWADESLVCLFPDGEVYEVWFDDPPQKAEPGRYHIGFTTGLKDKHGKGIFEWDIVVFTNHLNGRILLRECRWHEAYPAFVFCPVGKSSHEDIGGWKFLHYLADTKGTMEIVGNIYENPELIPKDEVQK